MALETYSERLAEADDEACIGSVDDAYGNAMTETINGLFKVKVMHRRGPWQGLDSVENPTLEWVDWFNNRRLLEPIGNITPAVFEETYYTFQESQAVGAGLT